MKVATLVGLGFAHAAPLAPTPFSEGCGAQLARLAQQPGPDGMRAALRAGRCALEEGRVREAVALLDRAAVHPTLRAYALLWAAQAARAAQDPEGARRRLAQVLALDVPQGTRAEVHLQLGELHRQNPAWAAVHAGSALQEAAHDEQRVRAGLLLARAQEASGRVRDAVASYTMAWWAYPGTPGSDQAQQDLLRLLGRLPDPPAEVRVQRARRLVGAQALAEWQLALRRGLRGRPAAEAHLRIGALQLGRPEALEHLRRAASGGYWAEARYWTGVALARLGRAEGAVRAWTELVQRATRSPWAARAMWALAWEADGRGDLLGADRWWALLALRFPASALADHARWQRGWVRYRTGRYAEAERLWLQATRGLKSPLDPGRLYWAGLSRLRRGLDGRPLWQRLAEQVPHSYYGQRARERLGLPAPPRPRPAQPVALPLRGFAPAAVELAALGFYEEATGQAEHDLRRVSSHLLRRVWSWSRARLQDHAGAVEVAELLVAPWRPESASEDAGVWQLSYPLPYRSLVERWARRYGLDPLLVQAVMREESRFRRDAVSPAGAVGLLQLLPSTAAGLDPRVKVAQLVDPETNVRLGVAYLAAQLQRFRGDLVLALAAYNAGPGAAGRFLHLRTGEVDEFVERIPYGETRAYVKRVLESYGIYRWLYSVR